MVITFTSRAQSDKRPQPNDDTYVSSASPSGLDRVGPAKPPVDRPKATYASVVLLMAMGAGAQSAAAAVDGSVAKNGSGSTGHVGISMTIPERIEVQGLQSVELSSSGSSREVSGCISGHGSTQYHLSTYSTFPESGQPFELSYAANDDVLQPLTMGEALRALDGAGAMGCAEGKSNARLSVRIGDEVEPGQLESGYVGAVTLLIAPE